MKNESLVRLLCAGCLAVASVFAQEPPPPPPAAGGGAPAGGPGGGPGGPGGGRGGFDPAQFQQRMMQGIKERLQATDEEWKVIEPRVTAVFEKQRALRDLQGLGRGMFRGGRDGQQRESPAPVAAVEKAIEAGDAAGIKTALEALRKARTEAEAEVTKARQSLREVLSVKQEAQLVLMMGILD
jgi:hypothetical protein